MQLLTDDAVRLWAADRGIQMRGRKLVYSHPHTAWIAIEMPPLATDRMLLAADLLNLGEPVPPIINLLWLSTWRIWSEWNDDFGEFIITTLRNQGGVITSLKNESGHLFGPDERKLACAIFWHTMLFNWYAYLAPITGNHIIECSHDEIVWIMCKGSAAHNQALLQLERWKPRQKEYIKG